MKLYCTFELYNLAELTPKKLVSCQAHLVGRASGAPATYRNSTCRLAIFPLCMVTSPTADNTPARTADFGVVLQDEQVRLITEESGSAQAIPYRKEECYYHENNGSERDVSDDTGSIRISHW